MNYISEALDKLNNKTGSTTLQDFFSVHGSDYRWETSLEEAILTEEEIQGKTPNKVFYKIGDIVMVNKEYGPHRIVIITRKLVDKIPTYAGYLLSTSMEKANKNNKKFPDNIYIADYSTIIYSGPKPKVPAIIKVDELIEFNQNDFSDGGTYKGTVKNSFLNFINNRAADAKAGKSFKNAHRYWE